MKKTLRLVLKFFLGLLLLLFIGFMVLYTIYDQPLPQGEKGMAADNFANTMLEKLNAKAYHETDYLEWTFRGGKHRYLWAKNQGLVRMEWADFKVLLDLGAPQKSAVFKNDIELEGKNKSEIVEEAVAMFNNDSFWLVAPFKVFDSGTTRQLVLLEDGSNGLLVTYASGGSTPGDSYLWILGKNGLPASFKMWVNVIPIGGLEATWSHWKKMETGVMLPSRHELGPLKLDMGEVKAFNSEPILD